ncbi:cation:proton antiporter [Acetohalobium arabaticum]|uniref:Sodium/proton antiporter, CPA1 family (TC 2.A.36) n=1 Tax=Acetohalobium arabaticum (strain ATCC 49924 / DSM 5501 / Z-7288) TaxID=574087 RepID=D9QPG8_ACEAZ|nr:cation:proton antiporter [Acetohalobium arabaticum]ADL12409.1 sodium/proton antiporter, CPA1 family (TC 2.A.36) [Acetohalobium arabaticum DSM 5501]
MALSLAVIILLGLIFNRAFKKMKLPGLLGMLILGILIGPYGFNLISEEILTISPDLRKIALIVILLRAGLGIEKETLKKVGVPAVKLSFIPSFLEGFTVLFVSMQLFGLSFIEGGILGFIIAAVSPAVVVPQMLNLIDNNRGADKGIPTLILTGASIDDVIAITIFSTFLGFYGGSQLNIAKKLLNVPISILMGVLLGIITGFILLYLFKKYHIRDTKKALLILSSAIILTGLKDLLKNIIPIAALLGVMAIGFILQERYNLVAKRLASKFNKIWVFAEIMLFVLVGAEVNIYLAINSGLIGLVIIFIGLIARGTGVLISVAGTELNWKERIFSVIAYSPKATVQAAIGAVPLSAGVESGELILAMAVLAIIITAPLGAAGIKLAGENWLSKPENNPEEAKL